MTAPLNFASDDISFAEPQDTNQRPGRIQYSDDVEVGHRGVRYQGRQSTDSLSIRSIHHRRSVDPATLIPIEYRTVYVDSVTKPTNIAY
jgi:hypothetical protein